MKYTLDLLDKAIDRYLENKTSTDLEFFKDHFISQREKIILGFAELNSENTALGGGFIRDMEMLNSGLFNKIYTHYRIKNFRYLNELFSNDEHELIITRYNENEIERLLKLNKIEKNRFIVSTDPEDEAEDMFENRIEYKIIDIEVKNQLFLEVKWAIRWKEFERKLRPKVNPLSDNGQPLEISGKEMGKSERKSKQKAIRSSLKPSKATDNKLKRYKEYVENYKFLTGTENLSHNEAEKKTCEKYHINPKTLQRAINAI